MLFKLANLAAFSALLGVVRASEPDFSTLESRATNADGSLPTYKNPKAAIQDRVNDLLKRMTLQEKVAQM
jgi:hypothetical protein